jgi:Trk K+ transport system NAD-binding subunit
VGGLWERGRFVLGGPETVITERSRLLLAGTRAQLDEYDKQFAVAGDAHTFVIIIGGGRVGRAAARALDARGVDYRIVEKLPERARNPRVVAGDAADIEVLKAAGIDEASCAIVTTHDDDVNVYLTLYCRRLRPEMLLLSRATLERTTTSLYRAGADFVLSYASTGANAIFNLLRAGAVMLVAEGLDVFTVPVPAALVGRTLAESGLREQTGCNLIAIRSADRMTISPEAGARLPAGGQLTLIGDREAERRFFDRYPA